MIHEKISEMVRVLRRGTRRRSAQQNGRRLFLESLEDRRMLATNIMVLDAFLVDGLGLRSTAPVLGEQLEVQVNFRTTDLFASAAYRIEYSIDGVILGSGTLRDGAGLASGSFSQSAIGWYAEPGEHTVDVVIDVGGNITEANEQDNSFSFTFTPERPILPSLFTWPETDTPFQDHLLRNYVDLDPTSGVRDWRGESATRNGHQGLDLGGANFAAMDAGRPVVAVADGVVVAITDGNPDRSTTLSGLPANLVMIDHGSGWQTNYLHLRRDSVEVKVGDNVQQGDTLGLEGSSGSSSASHLFFEVQHFGRSVETFLDPNAYWDNPLGYVGDEPYLVDSGITNYNPARHLAERPSNIEGINQAAGQTSYVWGIFSRLREDDFLEFTWLRPNGVVHARRSVVVPQNQATSTFFFSTPLPAAPELGFWTIDIRNNRRLLGRQFLEVTANGTAEIRIDNPLGDILLDERHSPVDFGTVVQKTIPPSITFTVLNHGTDTLTLSGLEVPEGYSITEGIGAALAPGMQETFTVILDTSDAGFYGGEIRVFSSDSDESIYNIAIEGTVTTQALRTITMGIGKRTISESQTTVANVTRTGNITLPLFVNLANDSPSQASIPSSVIIPAGQASVMFTIAGINDALADGVQVVKLRASTPDLSFAEAQNTLNIVDVPTIFVNIEEAEVSESAGAGASEVRIARLGGDLTGSLDIMLEVNDLTEAAVPLLVTMEPFQTVAVISLDAIDDNILDGDRTVVLTATATGFESGADSVRVLDHETVTIALSATTIAEDGGTIGATITRSNTDNQDPLVIQLETDDTSEATVIQEVTIPAGEASISFVVTAVDDDILDGDQLVNLLATAPAFVDGETQILVTDGEKLQIAISDFVILENNGSTNATITRSNSDIASSLRVSLSSSDTSEASVPAFVVIPPNQASFIFQITAVEDQVLDGNRNVTISAVAPGYRTGLAPLLVADHETLSISFAQSTIFEDAGMTMATVTRNNTNLGSSQRIILSSSDTTEATVPLNIQIAPNQASVTFVITSVDDFVVDGEQSVEIRASAGGYVPIVKSLIVSELPGLSITSSTNVLSENAAPAAITLRRHNTDKSQKLTVTLSTSPANQAVVLETVDIPPEESSVTIDFDPIDDDLLDGSQPVTLTVSAIGLLDSSTTITVEDHELLTLELTDSTIDEDGTGTTATVTRSNSDNQLPLSVFLQTDDESEATTLASVIIPANQASFVFPITAVDDALLDGPQNATITATASRYESASVVVEVLDKEQLTVSLSAGEISENGGSVTATVTRSNSDLGLPLNIQLSSDSLDEATTPLEVQILPQQSSATFTITAVDDSILDGTVSVAISAMSAGYEDGVAVLNVTDHESLSVTLDASSISERNGTTQGFVSRGNTDVGSPLTVELRSSDTSEAMVIATVEIPADEASTSFQVNAINDSIFDGDKDVTLTASAVGYFDGGAMLTVTDHEELTLFLSATEISEQLGSTTATVYRSNTDLLFPIMVTVSTDNPGRTSVATTVIIRAGQSSSAPFRISAIDNHVLDGPGDVDISVAATGYQGDTQTLTVLDRETLTLWLQDSQISENGGQTTAIVRRNNIDLEQSLLVNLAGDNPTEAMVSSVALIPAGESQSSPFTIFALDDSVFDGDQTVVISATANGYEPISASLLVTDLELLSVSIDSTEISERNGTAVGTVRRLNSDIGQPLVVSLMGSDATAATVPVIVVIPENADSQTFTISARDDSLLDGDQMFAVTVAAAGYADATAEIVVTDLESLTVNLVQSVISELGGSTTLTITRHNFDVGAPLAVTLTGDDPSEIIFTEEIIIPSNATSTTIDINTLDDALLDGTQTVMLTASADGYDGDTAKLDVTDHESLELSIADASISELNGTTIATVTRSNLDDNSSIVVVVTGQLGDPNGNPTFALGTVEIPAGEPSASFPLGPFDDDLLTGSRTLTISVSTAGFASADAMTIIEDVETLTITVDSVPLRESETATATITRNNTNREEVVTASLTNTDPSRLTVPAEVIIPAGQASTTFEVTSLNDGLITGNLTFAVDVSADGYQPADFDVEVEDIPVQWRNPKSNTDVNDDGVLTPSDVLALINDINLNGVRGLPLTGMFVPPPFLDVNGDGFVTSNDVVIVINAINNQVGSSPEGESAADLIDQRGQFDFVMADLAASDVAEAMMKTTRLTVKVGRDSVSRGAAHRNEASQEIDSQSRRMINQRDVQTDELEPLLDLLAADVALQLEDDE